MFVGIRTPVRSLFDCLEEGDTLEEFLHQFPFVKRKQVILRTLEAPNRLLPGQVENAGI